MDKKRSGNLRIQLIESDDVPKEASLLEGRRIEVFADAVVERDFRQVSDLVEDSSVRRPPRLCGSRTTCMAIVEMPEEI